jgi:hypothetical protein
VWRRETCRQLWRRDDAASCLNRFLSLSLRITTLMSVFMAAPSGNFVSLTWGLRQPCIFVTGDLMLSYKPTEACAQVTTVQSLIKNSPRGPRFKRIHSFRVITPKTIKLMGKANWCKIRFIFLHSVCSKYFLLHELFIGLRARYVVKCHFLALTFLFVGHIWWHELLRKVQLSLFEQYSTLPVPYPIC